MLLALDSDRLAMEQQYAHSVVVLCGHFAFDMHEYSYIFIYMYNTERERERARKSKRERGRGRERERERKSDAKHQAKVTKTMRKRMPKWMISSIPLMTVLIKTPMRGCARVVCSTLMRFKIMIAKPVRTNDDKVINE